MNILNGASKAAALSPVQQLRTTKHIGFYIIVMGILFSPYNALRIKGSISLAGAFFLVLLGLTAISATFRSQKIYLPPRLSWALLLTLLGFSAALCLDPELYSWNRLVIFIQIMFVVYVIPITVISNVVLQQHDIEKIVLVWVAANIIAAAIIFLQVHHIPMPIIDKLWIWRSGRAAGLNLHPNSAGFFASLVIPVCFALFVSSRRMVDFILFGLGLFLLLYAINYSGSRTALASSAIGITTVGALLLVSVSKRRLTTLLIIAVAVVAIAPFIVSSTGETAFSRLLNHSWTAGAADQIRALDNQRLWNHFQTHPIFGNGYNLYRIHNAFIGILGISGIIGALAFALREWHFMIATWHLAKNRSSLGRTKALAAGLTGAYVVWLLALSKNFVLQSESAHIMLSLIALLHFSSRTKSLGSTSQVRIEQVPPGK